MNVWQFVQTMNGRYDLTEELKQLQCRTLIFVGENSEFHSEAVHMTSKLDKRYCALVEVKIYQSVYSVVDILWQVLPFKDLRFKVFETITVQGPNVLVSDF